MQLCEKRLSQAEETANGKALGQECLGVFGELHGTASVAGEEGDREDLGGEGYWRVQV